MKFGFKTIIGAVIAGVGFAAGPEGAALLGGTVAGVAKGIGLILTAIGLRHAQHKASGV